MLVKCQNCPHLFYLPNLREVIIPILLGEAVFVILSRMAVLHCLPDSNKPICCFLLAFSHPILTDVKEYRCIIDFFLFFSSLDDKVPGLVRDISCLTVASCLVTFRLACVETVGTFWFTALLKWLHTLARAKWLFQFKSVGDEWRDTFCTPLTLLRDLFISECYRFHLKFEKRFFFYLKEKMPYETVLYLFTYHCSGSASSRNLYPSFSSNSWSFWAFSLHVSNFWLLLGFVPVPFASSPLEKKIFPLHLASLFPWQETKGRHCLWKSNPFQTCEHKVRLRESIALQTWSRAEEMRRCLGHSWAGAGGAAVKDKTAVLGSRIHARLPVCSPWPPRAPPSRCLWAELQWVLHKELQAGGEAPGSQLQPTDWRFDSLRLDTLTGITSAIICQPLFIFQRHG